MSQKLAWGIIGTGTIAHTFARELRQFQTGDLLAVGSRTQRAADSFGEAFQVPHRYGSYEQVLTDKDVQAVYIAVPHPLHAEWAIKAAEAGKHILCEKPIGINHAEAMTIIEAARRHDVFLMEAFMYRCHPQIARLVELIRSGAIGQVRVIESAFSYHTPFDPNIWYLEQGLAGGAIIDVGGYCTSVARLIAGAAAGQHVAEPLMVTATGHIVEQSRTDEYSMALLTFPGDILAYALTGTQLKADQVVRVLGSEGSLEVPDPWIPPAGENTRLLLKKKDEKEAQEIIVESSVGQYALEAAMVARYLDERQAPAMNWQDTLGNMQTLDRWRAAIGLVYDLERPQGPGQTLPFHKRLLSRCAGSAMKYGRIAGVDKPVSRLVMGVDNQTTWPHTAAMLDDFFEQGGNCFDSAHCYSAGFAEGICETMLGHWVKNRGIREQVVILDKGAEIPYCTPDWVTKHFLESLERLQMDYVDIYMIHQDNPQVPVDEFIAVLNEHKNAGRMRVFGVSNWSIERIEAANRWADAHGLTGISAISNNFSLAQWNEPVWEDCLSSSDATWRAWLTKTQMPIMPWSSQARGFFAGQARSGDISDKELERVWYNEGNFHRLERVRKMAAERGVLPINIALAYVLCQPFPTFPLIGPRRVSETATSLKALNIELTPEELRWLNLEDEALPG